MCNTPCDCHVTDIPPLSPSGFLCPAHTPDGAPCDLLNHLAAACCVTMARPNITHLPRLLISLAMSPIGGPCLSDSTYLSVLLDGRLIGEVETNKAKELATKLRTLKTLGQEKVSKTFYCLCTQICTHAHGMLTKYRKAGITSASIECGKVALIWYWLNMAI